MVGQHKNSPSRFLVLGSYAVGAAGLVVAIIGVFLAARGDRLAHSVAREQREIILELHPTVNQRDFTEEGLGLRVALINGGLRPVIIREATFHMDRCEVGEAIGWIDDVRIFDRHQINPGAVTDARLDLPVTIDGREGKVIALLFDYWTPCRRSDRLDEAAYQKVRRARRRLELSVAQLPPYSRKPPKFTLVADTIPGGLRRIPVEIQPGMTPRFDWQVGFDSDGPRVIGLSVRRKLGAQGQVDVLHLDVWGRFSDYHRSVERPIVAAESTHFPLENLQDGWYTYAFRLGSQTIAAGRFLQPAPCRTPYGFTQGPCSLYQ